jgi:hypothetical protein
VPLALFFEACQFALRSRIADDSALKSAFSMFNALFLCRGEGSVVIDETTTTAAVIVISGDLATVVDGLGSDGRDGIRSVDGGEGE